MATDALFGSMDKWLKIVELPKMEDEGGIIVFLTS